MTTEYNIYGRDGHGYYTPKATSAAEVSAIVKSGTVEQVEKIDTIETRWNGFHGGVVSDDWEDDSEKFRMSVYAACVDTDDGCGYDLAVCIEENVCEARRTIADHYGYLPTSGRIHTLRKIGLAVFNAKRGCIDSLDYYDHGRG